MKTPYHAQVNLLLNVLPDISAEPSFALHGGTAINLFVFDMPRLSVDIDLTYTKINKRDQALADINQMLSRVKARIEKRYPGIHIQHKPNWQTYDFKDYPSVKWKLANLEKLRVKQPDKYQKQLDLLHQVLNN